MQSTLPQIPHPTPPHPGKDRSKPKAVRDSPTLGGVRQKSALKANPVGLPEARSRTDQNLLLDNIAQLTTKVTSPPNYEALRKRARAKYYASNVALSLYSLNSDLKKSYGQTAWNCAVTIEQKGDKFTSRYCNQRWCIVCNRIRTAKLIKGYEPALSKLKDPQFVTLTIPNVRAQFLRKAIKDMLSACRAIQKAAQKKHERNPNALQIIGIRKVECTYNHIANDFHPHLHFLIQGKEAAESLRAAWLKRYQNASIEAQDIRPATKGSTQELFKYFSKIVTKVEGEALTLLEPLDLIFIAMRGLRTFQALGLRKHVTEDIEALQAEIIEGVTPAVALWTWNYSDWVNLETAEALTGHLPSEQTNKLIEGICLNYETKRRPPILIGNGDRG